MTPTPRPPRKTAGTATLVGASFLAGMLTCGVIRDRQETEDVARERAPVGTARPGAFGARNIGNKGHTVYWSRPTADGGSEECAVRVADPCPRPVWAEQISCGSARGSVEVSWYEPDNGGWSRRTHTLKCVE